MIYTTKMIVDRTEKNWSPSIWVYEIRPIIGLWRTHISACFERNFRSLHITFCGESNIII